MQKIKIKIPKISTNIYSQKSNPTKTEKIVHSIAIYLTPATGGNIDLEKNKRRKTNKN